MKHVKYFVVGLMICIIGLGLFLGLVWIGDTFTPQTIQEWLKNKGYIFFSVLLLGCVYSVGRQWFE